MADMINKPDLIQFRQDTLANWLSVNPILASGEVVCVFDTTNKPLGLKQGNGVAGFSALPWVGVSSVDPTIPYYSKEETSELVEKSSQETRTLLQTQVDKAVSDSEQAAVIANKANELSKVNSADIHSLDTKVKETKSTLTEVSALATQLQTSVEEVKASTEQTTLTVEEVKEKAIYLESEITPIKELSQEALLAANQAKETALEVQSSITQVNLDLSQFKVQTVQGLDEIGISLEQLSELITSLQTDKLDKGTTNNTLQAVKNGKLVKIHTPTTVRHVDKNYEGESTGAELAPFSSGIAALNSLGVLDSGAINYGAGQFSDRLVLDGQSNKNLIGLAVLGHHRTSISSLTIQGTSSNIGVRDFEIIGNMPVSGSGNLSFDNNLFDGQVLYSSSGFSVFKGCTFQGNILVSGGTIQFEDCDFADTSTVTIETGAQVVSANCEGIRIIAKEGATYLHLSGILSALDARAGAARVVLFSGSAMTLSGIPTSISIAEGVPYSLGTFTYQLAGSAIPSNISRALNDGLSANQVVAEAPIAIGYSTNSPYLSDHLIAIQEAIRSLQQGTGTGTTSSGIKVLLTVDSIEAPTTITALASLVDARNLYASAVSKTGVILQSVKGNTSGQQVIFNLQAAKAQAVCLTRAPLEVNSILSINDDVLFLDSYITGLTKADIEAFTAPQIQAAINAYSTSTVTPLKPLIQTSQTTAETALQAARTAQTTAEGKQSKIIATGATNLLTAPESFGGQPGTKSIADLQPTIIGAASSITTENLPHRKALVSDVSGKVTSSTVTTDELANLSGTTSKIQDQFSKIQELIPSTATTSNRLVDQASVNSAIQSLGGRALSKTASGGPFESLSALKSASILYYGTKEITKLSLQNDDNAIFLSVNGDGTGTQAGTQCFALYIASEWNFRYSLGVSFTPKQQAAIDSGIVAPTVTTDTRAVLKPAGAGNTVWGVIQNSDLPTMLTADTSGKAATATLAEEAKIANKLGTATIGALKKPIYLDAGVPKEGNALSSAAYEETTAFATAAQGQLADSALQEITLSGNVETASQALVAATISGNTISFTKKSFLTEETPLSVVTEGTGNVVTGITATGHSVTASKATTVPPWALGATKPTYSVTEVTGAAAKADTVTGVTLTVNGKDLTVTTQKGAGNPESRTITITAIPTIGTSSGNVPKLGNNLTPSEKYLTYFTGGSIQGAVLAAADSGKVLTSRGTEVPVWESPKIPQAVVTAVFTNNSNNTNTAQDNLSSGKAHVVTGAPTDSTISSSWLFKPEQPLNNYTGISLATIPTFSPTTAGDIDYTSLTRGLYFHSQSSSDLSFTACNIGLSLENLNHIISFKGSEVEAYDTTTGTTSSLSISLQKTRATFAGLKSNTRKITLTSSDSEVHLKSYAQATIDAASESLTVYLYDKATITLPTTGTAQVTVIITPSSTASTPVVYNGNTTAVVVNQKAAPTINASVPKLTTPVTISLSGKVTATATSFDGGSNIVIPITRLSQVASDYPILNQNTTGTAATAVSLTTARSLRVALNSTAAVTFNGTANQDSIPVSGILPVASGGTGATTANAKHFFASPTSAEGAPSFRTIALADIEQLLNDGSVS